MPAETRTSARQARHSSGSVEWYTPDEIVEPARAVMGGIDLDPASCPEANERVRATTFYTAELDGLVRPWRGRVFLNMPYGCRGRVKADGVWGRGTSNQAMWSAHLRVMYGLGRVEQAVMVCNAEVAQGWFTPLWAFPICFPYGRIRFLSPGGGRPTSPTHSNAVVYMGPRVETFRREFRAIGRVVMPEWPDQARRFAPVLA